MHPTSRVAASVLAPQVLSNGGLATGTLDGTRLRAALPKAPDSGAQPRATADAEPETSTAPHRWGPLFRWSARLTFDLGDNQNAALSHKEEWVRNGIELFQPRIQFDRMMPLVGPVYYAYGASAGYFAGESSVCPGTIVCTDHDHCECESGGASWKTRGLSYGPTAALALPGLASDRTGVVIWLPMLRLSHVITTASPLDCTEAPDLCPESDWSFKTVSVEASAGVDFIYRGTGGCGPRITLNYLFGDVAARQDLGLVLTFGVSFHGSGIEF